jgi:hypothetical protein
MQLYGVSRGRTRTDTSLGGTSIEAEASSLGGRSRASSVDSGYLPPTARRMPLSRMDSVYSTGGDAGANLGPGQGHELLDPDDPRVTGVGPNKIDEARWARETLAADDPEDEDEKKGGGNKAKRRKKARKKAQASTITLNVCCTFFTLSLPGGFDHLTQVLS